MVGCGLFPDLDHLTGSKPSPDAGAADARPRRAESTPQCGFVESYVKAQTPHRSAFFGIQVAAEENTFVVAAPLEKNQWTDARGNPDPFQTCDYRQSIERPDAAGTGVVRVYERTGMSWREQQLVIASRPGAERAIIDPNLLPAPYQPIAIPAYTVAVSGDRIAVGTPGDSTRGEFRGSVRLFRRAGGEWTEAPYLVENTPASDGDLFGLAVALSGDLLVVGAPGEEQPGTSDGGTITDAGAVHVYKLTDTAAVPVQRLTATFVDERALFGGAVALSSDWLAVGAPLEEESSQSGSPDADPHADSHNDTGSVYVYARDGDVLGEARRIAGTTRSGVLGVSLAVSGSELAAGSPAPLAGQGSVVLYDLGAADAGAKATLVPNDPRAYLFGVSVAMTPDFVVVGAPFSGGRADGTGSQDASLFAHYYQSTGSAYVFRKTEGGDLNETRCRIKASNADTCDNFGVWVAAAGDYFAVGAPFEDGLAPGIGGDGASNDLLDTGAVYLYTPRGP